MNTYKTIAVASAHLLEAGLTRTDRIAMLSFVAAKDGVDTMEMAKAFGTTRQHIYGAMTALEKARLTRQEIRHRNDGKKSVGYWYPTPYAKDVLSNFVGSFQPS